MDLRKLTLLIGSTLTVLSGATIAPSLPQIQATFSEVENAALLTRLILTMPALFIAVGSPLAGKLADTIGRKPIILIGLIVYAIGGTAPLYLNDMYSIIASRAVLGIGVAGLMTGFTTLIGDYYDGEERNQLLGLQGASMAFGGFVFLLAGGGLADVGWRWPFALYAFSLIILPFALFKLFEPNKENGISDPDNQVNSLDLAGKLTVAGTLFLGMLFFVIFYMMPVQLPFYLKDMGVESNIKSGVALACLTLTGGISGLIYRRIKTYFNFTQVYALSFLLAFIGYFMVSASNSYILIIAAQIIGGLGFGLFMPNANLCLINLAPFQIRGRVIGGMTTAVFLGQFLSPIVVSPLREGLGLAMSFRVASFILAGICLTFLILLVRQRNTAPSSG